MAQRLLELPPELLVHILALLAVQDLLKFSQTSYHSRLLANSNLHTLSLGLRLSQTSYLSLRPDVRRYRRLQHEPSALEQHAPILPLHTDGEELRESIDAETQQATPDDRYPPIKWVRLPDANTYDYSTLLHFHDALFKSILLRHGTMLQTLNLCLWTFTRTVAASLARLPALRSLSIKTENDHCTRAVPRTCIARERFEQKKAWSLLASDAIWTHHLRALRIENADLNLLQLATILHRTRSCRELSLSQCKYIGKELWSLLGKAWEGRAALQRLLVAECGSVLDSNALNAIGKLTGLQYLNLQGCVGMDSEAVGQWNKDVGHIPEIVPPRASSSGSDLIIEVDPAYL